MTTKEEFFSKVEKELTIENPKREYTIFFLNENKCLTSIYVFISKVMVSIVVYKEKRNEINRNNMKDRESLEFLFRILTPIINNNKIFHHYDNFNSIKIDKESKKEFLLVIFALFEVVYKKFDSKTTIEKQEYIIELEHLYQFFRMELEFPIQITNLQQKSIKLSFLYSLISS